MSTPGNPEGFIRRATGIPGLDRLLLGGILAGSVFIVQGPPGAGKTILANQACFHHAKGGGKALYVTLLAESHDRLLRLMSGMRFFDPSLVPSHIYFVSGFDILENDGLAGILQLLTSETRRCGADLLVLDGFFVLETRIAAAPEFRRFVNDLSTLANLTDLTVLLLSNSRQPQPGPEHTMVDGWIDIEIRSVDYRSVRDIEVRKYRGSDFISGRHPLTVDDEGMTIYPRLETVSGGNPAPGIVAGRVGTGIAALDTIMEGGLPRASATLVLGATGVGKTTLGLHFASLASPDEPALYFTFFETAERLRLRADIFGMPFSAACAKGGVHVSWHPPAEALVDKLGYEIIETVRSRNIRRLVIDGVDGLALSAIHPRRISSFLTALTNTLRDLDVTTIYMLELSHLISSPSAISIGSLSALAENVILLRYQEREGRLHRLISVLKARESGFDPTIREFAIAAHGIEIGGPAPYAGAPAWGGAMPGNILPWEPARG